MINLDRKSLYLFFVTLFYVSGLIFSYSKYLVIQEFAPIFKFHELFFSEILILCVFIFFGSLLMPKNIKTASAIFIWILFYFLYVPIFVFNMGYKDSIDINDALIYFVIFISFVIISLPGNLIRLNGDNKIGFEIPEKLVLFIFFSWLMLLIIVMYEYSSIMSFSGLNEIYIQRELGKADSIILGYVQVYFGYVFSMALVAIGLYKRNNIYIVCGVLGAVILYMITAERTILLLPLFVFTVYKLTTSFNQFKLLTNFIIFLSLYFFLIGFFGSEIEFFNELGFYFLTRIVATPGVFFIDYYNYFNEIGYTNYSHVRGFDMIFTPSINLILDPLFPQIGKIVARDVHHTNSNSNASFLSSDGAAAFGLIGVMLISLLFSFILNILNKVSLKWPIQLVSPIMAPIGLMLTNGSLFTALLSFGLFFWIIIFHLLSSKNLVR